MKTQEIAKEANEALSGLIALLSKFEQEQINTVPFEGSWTAGQLAQHMIKANSGFADILRGPVKDTERKPDEVIPKIKNDFLNFDIKMTTPDFIKPEAKSYDKNELLSDLKNIREKVNNATETLDLTKTCMAFELPVYGYLTRQEAISFIICHTQRHTHQLKNIYQKLI
ncbi:DinB family protein [Mucilaginibacter sp. OK098]|uniref:DinB family protein n=1 Tax=Mucilaginibacter sp. OK098 TaxID=1855297 RepID=UPI00092308E2|nr:DinB family protein [Mucilaginibacter sp. OK098]SHL94086.1 DinB superfamily protein [Mucilaginibacter sp. OK098]